MGVKPKLTVITASFNSEKTIKETFNSILKQNYRPLEYVVIDGASKDKTISIIKDFEQQFKQAEIEFKWISEKDLGIYNAWNKGLEIATGNFISFLGSDDMYNENAIKCYAQKIQENVEIDFVTAKATMVSGGKLVRNFGESWKWDVFKKEMKILHSGGFLNRIYLIEFGTFDENFEITGDYELLLRKGTALKVAFIDKFLVTMGADGVSSSLVSKALKEANRAKVKNNARNRFLAFLDYNWVLFKIKLKSI